MGRAEGGGVKLAADLHEGAAWKVEFRPALRSESSQVTGPEADVADEIVRANSCEELVACVCELLKQDESRELGEFPLRTMSS